MNRFKTAAVAILFLLVSGLAFAQAEPQDETKPRQDQQEAKPPKADKQDEGKPQDQMKPPKADKQEPGKDQPEEAKPSREEHGEKQNGEAAQGGEHARPAGKSAHIPDEKFRANFGREHTFTVTRVIHETTIVPGRTRSLARGVAGQRRLLRRLRGRRLLPV